MKIQAQCFCGTQVELWVPPTVRCPACKAVFIWQRDIVCVHPEQGYQIHASVIDSLRPEIPEGWFELANSVEVRDGDLQWDWDQKAFVPLVRAKTPTNAYIYGMVIRHKSVCVPTPQEEEEINGPKIPDGWFKLADTDRVKEGDRAWHGTTFTPVRWEGKEVAFAGLYGTVIRKYGHIILEGAKEEKAELLDPSLHKNPFAKPQKCKTVEEWMQKLGKEPQCAVDLTWAWYYWNDNEPFKETKWSLPFRIWGRLPGFASCYVNKEEAVASLKVALIATGEIEP